MDNDKAFEDWWDKHRDNANLLRLKNGGYLSDFMEMAQKAFNAACAIKDEIIKKLANKIDFLEEQNQDLNNIIKKNRNKE